MGSSILNLTQVFIMIIILLRRTLRRRPKEDTISSNSRNLKGNYNSAFDIHQSLNNVPHFETCLAEKTERNSLSNSSMSRRKKLKKSKYRQRVRTVKLSRYALHGNESSQRSSTHPPSSLFTSIENLQNQPAVPPHADDKKHIIKPCLSSSSINEQIYSR